MENNIAKLRKEKGYSQKEFAEMVGVSHWWLNKIENGKKTPSLNVVCDIAEKLGTTTDQIILK